MTDRKRIAIIGTGITGLAAAWLLRDRHDIAVYEKDDRPGGHSHTVTIDYDGTMIPVDTGFIVYNEVNYPNLTRLFATLGVKTQDSNMSFAVSAQDGRLEWAGDNLGTVFAQKINLARPRFLGMLRDIMRFNQRAVQDLNAGRLEGLTLGQYIAAGGYGDAFREDYLLPMGAAIWSTPVADMSAFPAASFVRFFNNHALLRGLEDRHQWRTVSGGSIQYVRAIATALGDRLRLSSRVWRIERDAFGATVIDGAGNRSRFDAVILACHGDQALSLIDAPSDQEANILGAFRYTLNHAVLHRDPGLMPKRRKVWSSWNYLTGERGEGKVALSYWMNRLQGIDPAKPVFVSLNPHKPVRDDLVFGRYDYEHPMFDAVAIAAQRDIASLQGQNRLWFAGSYCGNGFHEDGLKAAIEVAADFGVAPAWQTSRQMAAE